MWVGAKIVNTNNTELGQKIKKIVKELSVVACITASQETILRTNCY